MKHPFFCLLLLATCRLNGFAAPPAELPEALRVIEQTRKGRHWVSAQMDPPKSPTDSQKTFQLEPGLQIELVAAEPLVFDPVAITFDQRGRMFVAEYQDYPLGPAEGKPWLSRVVMLADTNGDGRADRRHVFADNLQFTHSLMAYRDGILVTARTELIHLVDTDGDNRADVRKVLLRGFKPAHSQRLIANPRWGMDNWIYLNYGAGDISSERDPEKRGKIGARDLRFHPGTLAFEATSTYSQYGNTFDRWGRRYFCSNRNPIMTTMLSAAAAGRNPHFPVTKAYADIAPFGGDTRVFPLKTMKSNHLSHNGTHTSACGTTAYIGDQLGDAYRDSVFVCEPVGHLVTRSIVSEESGGLKTDRARPDADFLASSDTWFRPSSLANGPDGALYLADMYRLHVEHPKFFPAELVGSVDWRAGEDRGRIYRITKKGAPVRKYVPAVSSEDAIKLLADANGWRRYLGQRLIVEERKRSTLRDLEKLLSSARAETRLHALWTLDGLGLLEVRHFEPALRDRDAHVRSDAVKLAGQRLSIHGHLLPALGELAEDVPSVRRQLAIAMGNSSDERATAVLTQLAARDGGDLWTSTAILTSADQRAGAILSSLLAGQIDATTEFALFLKKLATLVGAHGDEAELTAVIAAVSRVGKKDLWRSIAVLNGLATGLPRYRGALGRMSLVKLLRTPPAALVGKMTAVQSLLETLPEIAEDAGQSLNARVGAVELFALEPFAKHAQSIAGLLRPDQPPALQLTAINALRPHLESAAADFIFDRWSTFGPGVRTAALANLMRRAATTTVLLKAMLAGRIPSAVLSVDQRARLLVRTDTKIRALATKLLGSAVSSDRLAVAKKYRPALELKGDAGKGAEIFGLVCATCHRARGKGHSVGPDITDVRNRSAEAILYDILDPNRGVEPQYTAYEIETKDDRSLSGLLLNETPDSVTLQQAGDLRHIISRSDITELRASSLSLMPEGIEQAVSVQQMADLITFLQSE